VPAPVAAVTAAGRPCAEKRVVRGEQRGEKEDAPAPIAAVAAAGRPRARGIRAPREIGLAQALFAEGGRARLP
jgi:hypothetical protein